MTIRRHLPILGLAVGIAIVIVGAAILLSGPDATPNDPTAGPDFSQSKGAQTRSAATSFSQRKYSRAEAPFADATMQTTHAAGIRSRFLQLSRKDKYTAIDEALRLKAADRNIALATLSSAWKNDPRRGFKELAQIIGQITKRLPGFSIAGMTGTDLQTAALDRPSAVTMTGTAQPAAFLSKDLIQSLKTLAAFPDDPEMPLLAMRLANRLLDGPKRASVLNAAALAYVNIDPALAFSFGNSLSGSEQQQFIGSFSKGWAAQDPEAAAQWAASIEDPAMRVDALTNAIDSFSRNNPGRAAQWLESLPEGSARQSAIRELAANWASQDTAAALVWAGQLDSSAHQQAVAAIQAIAPVGVGITLTTSENGGYPIARDLVSAGPAALSGSVRQGDQIVGVLNSNQQWIGTTGLPLGQVVTMIRGPAGKPVQLRLLPQGATDPSQARTVTIVRQQILLKRSRPDS